MFKLSENTDPNKIFIVNRSELEGRIDPFFYKSEYSELEKKIEKSKYKKKLLKELIYKVINGLDFRDYDIKGGIPYIKVANIKKGFFDFSNLQYITPDIIKSSKDIQLEKGNLLLTRKGTFGNALCLEDDYNYIISSEVFYLKVKQSIVLSKYLEIYFNSNIGQKFFKKISIGAIMGSLSQDAIKSIKIPLPPLEIQQQIVDLYEKAYTEKQQKEAEAQRLLDSIDDYLLGELGIALPKEEESLQQTTNKHNSYNLDNDNPLVKKGRLFLTNLSEVTGKRIDPKGYDIKTKLLKSSIDNIDLKKFIALPLKSFIIQSIAGNWGIDENEEVEENEEYQKCLVIRATEFDNQYNLNLDNSRVKYRLIKKRFLSKIDLKENDLLIEKSGGSPDQPVGRIAIITQNIIKNNILCYSNFIHKIRVDNKKINPKYLFCFLKMMHNIRLTEAMQSQTNGIRNLIMSTYLNQNIVIPISENGIIDIQKQTEIANRITAIREEAKKLQLEAINILETAKRDIEQMILGD